MSMSMAKAVFLKHIQVPWVSSMSTWDWGPGEWWEACWRWNRRGTCRYIFQLQKGLSIKHGSETGNIWIKRNNKLIIINYKLIPSNFPFIMQNFFFWTHRFATDHTIFIYIMFKGITPTTRDFHVPNLKHNI